jgi:hypothetical protein
MPVDAAVAKVMASWDSGALGKGEVVARLVDLLTATNVAEVVAAVPGPWRAPFEARLRAIGQQGPLVDISLGNPSHEPDAHFEDVIRPAIRAWVRQQG